MSPETKPLLLLGCDVLHKEISFLIRKNGWPVETLFLDSALHIDYERLAMEVTSALQSNSGRRILLCYGNCHPRMDSFYDPGHTVRIESRNCVEMLLGPSRFLLEQEQGSLFLLEKWIKNWEPVLIRTFGCNREMMQEIIRSDQKYLLAITTPCSDNFRKDALSAGVSVGLPVRWLDAGLDHLESLLQKMIERESEA